MSEKLFGDFYCGKSSINELEWENKKCNTCGEKLVFDKEVDVGEIKVCPKCNERHLLIRRLSLND